MVSDTPLFESALSLAASADAAAQGLFLLADQSALPRIVSLWPRVSKLRWASLLPSGVAQPDGATPLLIDVSDINTTDVPRRALNELYAHGRWANCLSLLVSAQSFDRLTGALSERTRAELPDHLNVRLRYFDTRTMPLLLRLLRPAQYAAFMGCVESWHFIDRRGLLHTMPAPESRNASSAPFAPLVFDAAQERMLIDDGTTDAVIDQLLEQHHPAFCDATPPQQYEMISVLVNAARKLKIDEVRDVLLYCCAALEHGSHFEQRPPWSERLAQHRRGSMTLEEALTDGS